MRRTAPQPGYTLAWCGTVDAHTRRSLECVAALEALETTYSAALPSSILPEAWEPITPALLYRVRDGLDRVRGDPGRG